MTSPSRSASAFEIDARADVPPTTAPTYTRDALLAAVRALAPRLCAASAEVERGRTLTEPLVQAMVDAGLYRMLLPRSLGGGEVDPLTYFDVVEALARIESAAAWSVLISTSTMTGTVRAFADEQFRAFFTTTRQTIMGGSAPPKGRAVAVPGGYRLTGRWSQGSNVLIAGWMHLGCHVYEGDTARRGEDGRPVYRYCMVPTSKVEVLDTWNTTGMRGTGSHDYTVTDVFIPERHVHPAVDRSPHHPQPLYQF